MTKLELWRSRRKMSIQELADKSGVNRATVSRIERRVSKPYGQTLGKLAEVLQVDPSELVEVEQLTPPGELLAALI